MAWAKIGASQGTFSGSATQLQLTRTATTVGNMIVVAFGAATVNAAASISDTQGNTWVVVNPDWSDATNVWRSRSWYCLATNTSSTTITVLSNTSSTFLALVLAEFSGHAASPLDQVGHSADGASGTPTSPSITPSVNDCLLWAFSSDSISAVGLFDGTAGAEAGNDGSGDWAGYRFLTGRSGVAMTAAFTGSGAYNCMVATFKPGVAALDQYGYRFRNDDGSETTATWQAAQNAAGTIVPDERFRLRMGVNATGDTASQQHKLQYRISGGEWRDVDTTG